MKWVINIIISLLLWAGIIWLFVALKPASAQTMACMAGDSTEMLQTWIDKTGQRPLLSFQLSYGDDSSTPAYILLNPADKHITVIYRGPNDTTCLALVGTDAKASPAETVVPKEVPKEPGTAL
jgi:hypothetical protein